MVDWKDIANRIAKVTGKPFVPDPPQSIGGGCINRSVRLSDGNLSYFVKINQASLLAMFEAEYEGLLELANSKTLHTPRPICFGVSGTNAWLAIEYLEMYSNGDAALAGSNWQKCTQQSAIDTVGGITIPLALLPNLMVG